ncbi:hypothetical protein SNE40_007732 [Patella caerulea]|uniref:Zinc finger homeobox protein 4 n=1 Tax=Patella caerulea TaxID=87958 RepID=A0AAN8PU42_PATCE
MDISSLTSDVSEESLVHLMIPLAPTTSMGDQQLPDIDGVDSNQFNATSNKMATTMNDSSSKNFLDYHNNLVLGSRDLNLTNKVQLFPETKKTESTQVLGEKLNGTMDIGSDKEDPVDCDNCDGEFTTLQQFMDHKCSKIQTDKSNCVNNETDFSDAESFNGKIVYNPDGSAYIIEESESNGSDNDSIDIPQQDGAIVDNKGTLISSSPAVFPQIANAFFVPRNPGSVLNSLYQSSISSNKNHQTPIMHSYRVYDVRTKDNNNDSKSEDFSTENHTDADGPTVPTKPILMCFICRLSFGYTKSFHSHAATEHLMKLTEKEKRILNSKNSSAIIQGVGKDKHPLMSFLEPVFSNDSMSNNNLCHPSTSDVVDTKSSTNTSFVYTKPKSVDIVVNSTNSNPLFQDKHQYSHLWGIKSVESREMENNNNIPDESDSSEDESDSLQPKLVINSGSSPATNSLSVNSIIERRGSPKASSEASLLSSPLPQNIPGFLGMCDEHPQGRLQGVECPKCDIVLSSSQSLGGHMTMMHSRNSCKTLKCPKCNWHYKYQETLDIHMKEKHPENDAQCMYCLSNQSHPRLARGETYSCGYKPYRCEVCNYSTTTKGNLSIHMQSDKHINNMQDLANGSTEMKMPPSAPPTPTTPSFPDESQFKKLQKPKQTWRCDVCNYETTVARNLRIHMTSEKHTHNMMVLQQNMKHMQQDMHMQMNQLMMLGQQDHSLFGLPSPMGGGMFPYDQSMLMTGIPPGFDIPVNLSKENGTPLEAEDIPDAAKLFHCCVCNNFTTDSLEALHQHLQLDRTKQQENEHVTVSGGTYLCNLCSYKTNLKANFQLHSKTDKHIQRLQLVNHIKEGGPGNEWRLKYLNVSNPVQVRCNSCDYYTNSIHKLNVHTTNLQHESSAQLFRHLQYEEAKLNSSPKYYHCAMCQYSTKVKLNLIHHVQSVQHLQNDAAYKSRVKEDSAQSLDVDQIFQVRKLTDDDDIDFDEDEGDLPENIKLGETEATEVKVEGSSTIQSSPNSSASATVSKSTDGQDVKPVNEIRPENTVTKNSIKVKWYHCPLCQEEFPQISQIKSHLLNAHNVKPEGLERILLIAEQSDSVRSSSPAEELGSGMPNVDKQVDVNWDLLEADHAKFIRDEAVDSSMVSEKNEERQYRCQTCSKSFGNIDQLYAHQNELGHLELKQTPRGPGYLCWKKGCNQYFKTAQALQVHFREIHARRNNLSDAKFSCSQCSLVFPTEDKLNIHSQYHLVQSVSSCPICSASMKGVQQIFEHLESTHSDIGKAELEKHLSELNTKAYALYTNPGFEKYIVKNSASGANLITESSGNGMSVTETVNMRDDEDMSDDNSCYDDEGDMLNNSAISDENVNFSGVDGDKTEADVTYREQQFMEDYMNSQAIAEGSYEDHNRKFKCHRCKVAFTKQTYLTSHNKTLQHRRGEKLGYPVDRYLDPNRPFKCDVCKESFTQKSILLVHYNSVSHLHKSKQAAHQGSLSSSLPTSQPSTTTTRSASSPPSTSSSSSTATTSPDSGRKPYRCNICRVAYNQGATLDIHIRSVAHQTRASKIHELAMTGRVDITLPLIENPDLGKVSTQQAQALTDMIHQTQAQISVSNVPQGSLIFPGMSGLPAMPGLSGILPPSSTSSPSPGLLSTGQPLSSSNSIIKSDTTTVQSKTHSSSSTFHNSSISHDSPMLPISTIKQEHDEDVIDRPLKKEIISKEERMDTSTLDSLKDKENNNSNLTCQKCNSTFTNQESLIQHQKIYCYLSTGAALARPRNVYGRFKPQVQKNLLENIGFECVMQFNEYTQACPAKKEKDEEKMEGRNEEVKELEIEEKIEMKPEQSAGVKKERPDMPEINRSHCSECNKEFSSVWVLKAHQEEVHKEIVPIGAVETFGAKFKTDFEMKQPKEPETPLTPQSSSTTDKPTQQEMPPPPPPSQMPNHFDISQLMPMFGMMPMPLGMMPMGMPSPMMPMMLPGMDMSNFMSPMPPMMDSSFSSAQQQMQQAAAANQKRVRTRISDDQLKILRAHFDITNSPSDDQIKQMSDLSGLPQKVIKHWFRNTLFKERQRNKDSPYNFNNPPSTSIDIDEYEKTGKLTDIKQEPSDDEDRDSHDIDMDSEKDRYELCFKPEPPRLTIVEDRKEYDCRSNASTPSTTSSIPSTPNTSIPNTPTPSYGAMYDEQSHNSFDHSIQSASAFRRANRTRFTDYQIKMLQEYFEQNAYPKDDELEHLSKMLGLSPRVIVVWFQNARQKARKIYENQPATEAKEPISPFQRTPGLNYQCKKCSAVFQRYYELIKHQKRMCNPESKNKNNVSGATSSHSTAANSSSADDGFNDDDDSDSCMSPNDDTNLSSAADESSSVAQSSTFQCDKCDASFNRLTLWQEHQAIHSINPALFPGFSSNSAFDVLQSLAQHEGNTGMKRKFESDDDLDQPRDKRLRTTILPEQLDYLYQKYQLDCNPSRKQLENISREVGLKKRVVQVWFQNTRARERKGQYRAHQQIIHKRCPFCRALFRAKSALESHLATKHPEEMAKREFNIDTIPDASLDGSPPTPQPHSGPMSSNPNSVHDLNKLISPGMSNYLPFMHQSNISFSSGADSVQMSMQQLYEDSFKKYISDLSSTPKNAHSTSDGGKTSAKRSETESKAPSTSTEDDTPLDLSKPIKVVTDNHDKTSDGPSTDMSEFSMEDHYHNRRISLDDSISDTMSEAANDELNIYTSNPSSPNTHNHINKRYRTQMTSMQVRVMKTLFTDYKTPTMAECELLGREIGLPKRVIQVWFQNARAKEKKSKLAYSKSYNSDVEVHKTPEECKLCKFKYSHKFTVQDHIFTKKHIDNVRKYIASQNDAEREMSDPSGVSTLLRQQRDMDRMRKVWDETQTPPSHLAQLQAMGLNAMGLSGTASPSSSSNTANKVKSEKKEKKDIKTDNAPTKEQAAEMAMNAQMMSALGGFLPGMDPNFLSYMYSGLPGFYPGMGMPMMQPGMFPGAEHMMAYDPLAFGTPLTLLQIPQQAIKQVGEKLSDPKSTRAQYTQDCKQLTELKTMVGSTDFRLITESLVDVGYICKKCQMVYPAKDACVNHQQSLCFAGGKVPENVQPMLKLEQIQYECKPCAEKVSSLYEMKVHCQLDTHKLKVAKYIKRKSASGTLPVSVASSPSPSKHRATPTRDNLNNFQNSVAAEPAVTQPKIE